MGETGDGADPKPGVTMEDLKSLETTMKSSMDTQLKGLRDMIVQLLPKGSGSTPPPVEVNSSAAQAKEGEVNEGTKESPPRSLSENTQSLSVTTA